MSRHGKQRRLRWSGRCRCCRKECLLAWSRFRNRSEIMLAEFNVMLKLGTYCSHWLKVRWSLILEVVRVGNLPWCPNTLVVWVVDERGSPFALVLRVLDRWLFPCTASRSLLA